MPRRWIIVLSSAVVVVAAVVAVLISIQAGHDGALKGSAAATSSTAGVASPYDLSELPSDVDFVVAEQSAFVSITLVDDNGRLASYGLDAERQAARDLIAAIGAAEEVDTEAPSAANSGTGFGGESGADGSGATEDSTKHSTLVFVLPTHETLTFALDLDDGLVTRDGRTWRPGGNLRALIDSAIKP